MSIGSVLLSGCDLFGTTPQKRPKKIKIGSYYDTPTGRNLVITPVAGLFLTKLGFEKIFKTQWIFKIKERFQAMLE